MSIKNRTMKQTCVYWAPANTESGALAFDNYGQALYADPVEKDCRWEETSQVFVNINGIQETSKAVVMIDDIEIGGMLFLGTLDEVTDQSDPKNNENVWEIKMREKIPNLRGSIFYEWAYL